MQEVEAGTAGHCARPFRFRAPETWKFVRGAIHLRDRAIRVVGIGARKSSSDAPTHTDGSRPTPGPVNTRAAIRSVGATWSLANDAMDSNTQLQHQG